jgi:hypothetical protein
VRERRLWDLTELLVQFLEERTELFPLQLVRESLCDESGQSATANTPPDGLGEFTRNAD